MQKNDSPQFFYLYLCLLHSNINALKETPSEYPGLLKNFKIRFLIGIHPYFCTHFYTDNI